MDDYVKGLESNNSSVAFEYQRQLVGQNSISKEDKKEELKDRRETLGRQR